MKINCLSCGHKIDLDDIYDEYEGPIKCFACKNLLEIRTQRGRLKLIRLKAHSPSPVMEKTVNEIG